jgi:3-methyladenine DNA glycosylase/8-oxoguanine DNA glycosylase
MELFLPARQPFILDSVIRSHGWVQLLPFGSDDQTNSLSYLLELDSGEVVAIFVQETPGGVRVQVDSLLSIEAQSELAGKIAWMLGLDMDFTSFYSQASGEPKLATAAERARGRILRSATIFEDVVRTILTTNTTWSGTKRMVKALVDMYGAPLASNPEIKAFPTSQRLAAADVERLRKEGKLGYRAPYIHELAQREASGELDLEALKANSLPTPDLRKRLLILKGVGDYAAANLLMLLGYYDFIPVDSWALKMVSHEFYGGNPIGRKEVEAAFERWGEWQGLAFWLWEWTE